MGPSLYKLMLINFYKWRFENTEIMFNNEIIILKSEVQGIHVFSDSRNEYSCTQTNYTKLYSVLKP